MAADSDDIYIAAERLKRSDDAVWEKDQANATAEKAILTGLSERLSAINNDVVEARLRLHCIISEVEGAKWRQPATSGDYSGRTHYELGVYGSEFVFRAMYEPTKKALRYTNVPSYTNYSSFQNIDSIERLITEYKGAIANWLAHALPSVILREAADSNRKDEEEAQQLVAARRAEEYRRRRATADGWKTVGWIFALILFVLVATPFGWAIDAVIFAVLLFHSVPHAS